MKRFWLFLRDERAATSIEYGMIAVFASIAAIAGMRAIGSNMQSVFYSKIAGTIT